jgi:hypothetical protein
MYESLIKVIKNIPKPKILIDATTKKQLKNVVDEMKVHSHVINAVKKVSEVKNLSLDEEQLKLIRNQIDFHTDEIMKYAQEIARILGF